MGKASDMVDKITPLPLVYQPGTVFEYSLSFDVLGAVAEKVTGADRTLPDHRAAHREPRTTHHPRAARASRLAVSRRRAVQAMSFMITQADAVAPLGHRAEIGLPPSGRPP